MADERLEQRRRLPRRDHDSLSANCATGGRHVDGLRSECDSLRRRSFEEQRSTSRRCGGKAGAGTDGIQDRAVFATQAGNRSQPCLVLDGPDIDRRGIEAGVAPHELLSFEPRCPLGSSGDRNRGPRFEMALHVEPPEEGGKIEGRAPPRLKCVPSRAETQRLLEIAETDAGSSAIHSAPRAGAAPAMGSPSTSTALMPEAARACAVAQPVSPPDDGDVGVERTTMTG